MRGCLVLLTIAVAASAQAPPEAPTTPAGATVPSGVPLRVALEHRFAIKRVGEPIQGRLVEPIYVFDRVVLPAGSSVEGHIAEIGGVPARRRLTAILSGNFTPPRDVRAQFDTLVLRDSQRPPRVELLIRCALGNQSASRKGGSPRLEALETRSKKWTGRRFEHSPRRAK